MRPRKRPVRWQDPPRTRARRAISANDIASSLVRMLGQVVALRAERPRGLETYQKGAVVPCLGATERGRNEDLLRDATLALRTERGAAAANDVLDTESRIGGWKRSAGGGRGGIAGHVTEVT